MDSSVRKDEEMGQESSRGDSKEAIEQVVGVKVTPLCSGSPL